MARMRPSVCGLVVMVAMAFLLLPGADAWFWRRRLIATLPVSRPIASSCYNPSGSGCTWYETCLERKIPCRGGSNDYAIKYAKHYCERYQTRYNSFSSSGKHWVDAVRKCLQRALAPQLRGSPTCASIKTRAFDSHTPCYLNPGDGAPSFCDLSPSDVYQVFWTVKGAYLSEFLASIRGFAQVKGQCIKDKFSSLFG